MCLRLQHIRDVLILLQKTLAYVPANNVEHDTLSRVVQGKI